MSLDTAPVPELSGQQRRCHLLLMLYAPVPAVQLETISQINGVAPPITRQDIAEVASEIQRFHHLEIDGNPDEGYRIRGTTLNQRLCLLHWLRRALRCSPEFIERHFSPWLRQALGISQDLTTPLEQYISAVEPLINRSFDRRDRQFLQHYLLYCAWEARSQRHPMFNPAQRDWLHQKPEHQVASRLLQSLNQLFALQPEDSESDFLVLMLQ